MKSFAIIGFLVWATCLQAITKSEVQQTVSAVANKVIAETSYQLSPSLYTTGQGVQRIAFCQDFSCKATSSYYAHSVINAAEAKTTRLGFSYRGTITVWVNGQEVLAESADDYILSEYSYGWFSANKIIELPLNKGENTILIKMKGDNDPICFIHPKDHENFLDRTLTFTNPFDESNNKVWLMCGETSANDNPELGIKNSYQNDTKVIAWKTYADYYVQKLVTPENATYTRDPYSDWHYANGCTMYGILALYDATGDATFYNAVKDYADYSAKYHDFFQYQYNELNMLKGSYCRLFRSTMLDDTGGPAIPLAALKARTKTTEYDKILEPVNDYVINGQVRLDDGAFCRPEPYHNTLWADDLFMSVPYLLEIAKDGKHPEIYDDIANQIIRFNEHLYDKNLGLYWHGWFDEQQENTVAHWGRANGWIVWATSSALMSMPESHPKYKTIKRLYLRYIKSIVKYQNANGMWHQVLDKTDSYEETSCTAMFTMGIARAINQGWLSPKYKKYATKGWEAVSSQIEDDGTVHSICRGTGIGFDLDFYYERATFDHDPRGLGAVITAGAEMILLLEE